MNLAQTCGCLVLGGIPGLTLPEPYAAALRQGHRGGVVLFRRNVEGDLAQTLTLARRVHQSAPQPLLAVDQEGGRVARLGAPFLRIPSMNTVARVLDAALAERLAEAVGAELAAAGITLNFAPVVDVDTRPENPVIGDRAFGSDPAVCARLGVAWIRGLQQSGVMATAKHFPGHGDTLLDSHFDLPVVTHSIERMERVEWVPFRAAIDAGVSTVMTAHVVCTSLDPDRPATLSPPSLRVLRGRLGFRGLVVTDDLEMHAVAKHQRVQDAAVQAVAAGCDVLLVCQTEEAQERVFESLVAEAERSPAFRTRCEQARDRVVAARARIGVTPADDRELADRIGGRRSQAMADIVASRLAGATS
jgi:beta-N-acetylhexosaminidase